MNPTLRALACALVGAAVAAAESPAPSRVVVLDNENLLEGEVVRVEGGYQIRRPTGGDITLPARRVLAVVADRKAAFAVVAERANRRDADERLRLARWCSANGLPDEALAEAKTAARMRPGFRAAEQYVATLELVANTDPDPAVIPARADVPVKEPVTDVQAIEYNSESFPLFASRVHAILLNACANCHAKPETKTLRLTRTGGRSALSKNLMSALVQVNPAEPTASPLLTKSITPHGTATDAPFKSRNHPAYQTLEIWARFALAPEGTPLPDGPLPDARPAEPRRLPDLGEGKAESKLPAGSGDTFGQDSKSAPKPAKSPTHDPFDPAIFNAAGKPMK
ncbi:MAG TPA: hypothetical protein VKD90_04770 [Gemmataceae bacterium]|nr:hypothetical protein [Gemmataceae bacterium]